MQDSRFVHRWSVLVLAIVSLLVPLEAQKFYPDDPLEKEPPPWPTVAPERRGLSSILETVGNIFGDPGEQHPERSVITAGGVNTR